MSSEHHHACQCTAHRHTADNARPGRTGLWTSLLPMLACAVCPACLATYAKLLSLVGVGVGLSERQHSLLLAVAISVSLLVSAWRGLSTRRAWPLVFAAVGAALVLVGHLQGELHALEWAGVLTLLVSGVVEQFRLRRPRARIAVA